MDPDVASSAATQATIKRTDAARASVDPSSISSRFGRCSTRSARPRPLLLFFRSLSRCRFSSELMLRSSDRPLPDLGNLRVKGLSISSRGDSRPARASGRLSASKRSSQSNLGAAATHAAREMWLFLLPLTHETFPAIHSKHRSAPKALVLRPWSMLGPRDEKSAVERRLLFTDAVSSALDLSSGLRSQSCCRKSSEHAVVVRSDRSLRGVRGRATTRVEDGAPPAPRRPPRA